MRLRAHRPITFALVALTGLILANAPAPGWAFGGSGPSEYDTLGSPKPPAYKKGVARIEEGDYAGGIEYLEKAEHKTPDDPDVLNYLGFAHRKLGQNEKALDYYQRALREDAKHKAANEYLGELYLQMNDLPKAKAQLDVLKTLCDSCEELDALTKSIAAYEAK